VTAAILRMVLVSSSIMVVGCAARLPPPVPAERVQITPPPGWTLDGTPTITPVAQLTAVAPAAPLESYRRALARAHASLQPISEGRNAEYIQALSAVDPRLFGIAMVSTDGTMYEVGDSVHPFVMESISNVFTLARAMEELGPAAVQRRVPPRASPFVDAGALSTVDLLAEGTASAKWRAILGTMSSFAGRPLTVDDELYRSELAASSRDRGMVRLLQDRAVIKSDAAGALDTFTLQRAVLVNAHDLAVMAGTLANGGRNPLTGQTVVSPATTRHVLAVMASAGLYEGTGEWLFRTGVPGKSGAGGGIFAVVPGKFGIAAFSPPLDPAGNSVRAQRAIETIVNEVGGNLFAAQPRPSSGEATVQR
jgi:glutaminase